MPVRATILNTIADDFSDYQEYVTDAGGYLDRALDYAVHDLWQAKEWAWIIGVENITTTTDNRGPYALPSDFAGMVQKERVDRYYDYPTYAVRPMIADGDFGKPYPVTVNRVDNTLIFSIDPGDETFPVLYRKKAPAKGAELTDIPDEAFYDKYLINRTGYYLFKNSADHKAEALDLKAQSEMDVLQEWNEQRRGNSRPVGRTPKDIYDIPFYVNMIGQRRNSKW